MKPDPTPDRSSETYAPALIEGCKAGDRGALGKVFRAEIPYLERVLSRFARNRADLEDLLQATLEQAIGAFPRFRGDASVRTWLTRIAVRTALHHLKRPGDKTRPSLALVNADDANQPVRPDDEAEARRRLDILKSHLAQLDPKHHMAFVLFQVEGHSMEEVAALMDSSVSTTKSRVMWARRKLSARLTKDARARTWLIEYGEAGFHDVT